MKYKLRKIADLGLSEVKEIGVSHVAIRISPDDIKNVAVKVEVYSEYSKITNVFDDNLLYFPWSKQPKILNIGKGRLRHYVNFTKIPDAVNFEIKSLTCSGSVDESVSVLVELVESWNPTITQFSFFTKR